MPAYIGHTIMARDVYKKIDNKKVSIITHFFYLKLI